MARRGFPENLALDPPKPSPARAYRLPVLDDDHLDISERGRRGFGVLAEERVAPQARVLAIQHFHLHACVLAVSTDANKHNELIFFDGIASVLVCGI